MLMIHLSSRLVDIRVNCGHKYFQMDFSDEQKLVEDAKCNSDAFGRLYDNYFPRVYAFVAAKINDRANSEDLVSEIFMKIMENIGKFEWRGLPFAAWIFRIARNVLNDYYSKSGRNKTADIDEVIGLAEDPEKTSPLKKAAQGELTAAVKNVLSELPEKELTVVQLKFFSQLTNREIVDVTGISESNVAVILYRTLRKIKPDLKYFS